MADFRFLQNPLSRHWVVIAPRRAKRPDVANNDAPVCPFCLGREADEQELLRVGGMHPDQNWQIRVIPNKFPFANIHELIIHSPDHHKNIDELPLSQVELILTMYHKRFVAHQEDGQVYLFHNRGEMGGESLPHPHTQLVVVPFDVPLDMPRLDPSGSSGRGPAPLSPSGDTSYRQEEQPQIESTHFYLFCPKTSQWPDEVWIAPKERGKSFGTITGEQIQDLASVLQRVIQIMDTRHGHEFPFNFYIYPGTDWYVRLIPRLKTLGGFELGTGITVNTQDPQETIDFIQAHFIEPDHEKIRQHHRAEYVKRV